MTLIHAIKFFISDCLKAFNYVYRNSRIIQQIMISNMAFMSERTILWIIYCMSTKSSLHFYGSIVSYSIKRVKTSWKWNNKLFWEVQMTALSPGIRIFRNKCRTWYTKFDALTCELIPHCRNVDFLKAFDHVTSKKIRKSNKHSAKFKLPPYPPEYEFSKINK